MRLDPTQLTTALADADLRVLLMVVFHYTGDDKWLAPPYSPHRNVRLIADEDAGLAPEIQDEIRQTALALLTGNAPAALPDPDEVTLNRMMTHSLAEQVPAEYAPMMREQMGFKPLGEDIPRPEKSPPRRLSLSGRVVPVSRWASCSTT